MRRLARWLWNGGRTAHASVILGGWGLVTWGVASLTVWQSWPISGGLFLLSLAGWGHLRIVFSAGVYALACAGRSP